MKKRMMRIAALAMAATMTISLAACGDKADDASSSGNETKTEAESGTEDADKEAANDRASDDGASDEDKVITYWNIGTEGADKEALSMR